MECGSSVVERRTNNKVSPGSNPPLLPFRILGDISAQFGLTINATNTHMLVIDAESDADQVITVAGKAIGRVERFKFLASIVTNDIIVQLR